MDIPAKANSALEKAVRQHPYPLLFATLSGAHLYGFPSPDSDYDVRGAHLLPAAEVVGLDEPRETIEVSGRRGDVELDLVTHDIKKFFALMLKKNGYVLEQLHSPFLLHAAPELAELRDIAKDCMTRHHAHHYLGFAETQWGLILKEHPPRVKPLLYTYRVLLTGIHLMRTGAIECDLPRLNMEFAMPWLSELIATKLAGAETERAVEIDLAFHEKQVTRLRAELEESSAKSALPEVPSARPRLNDLLVRLRLGARH